MEKHVLSSEITYIVIDPLSNQIGNSWDSMDGDGPQTCGELQLFADPYAYEFFMVVTDEEMKSNLCVGDTTYCLVWLYNPIYNHMQRDVPYDLVIFGTQSIFQEEYVG